MGGWGKRRGGGTVSETSLFAVIALDAAASFPPPSTLLHFYPPLFSSLCATLPSHKLTQTLLQLSDAKLHLAQSDLGVQRPCVQQGLDS